MKRKEPSLAEVMSMAFAKLMQEDAQEHRRNLYLQKNREMCDKMWKLRDKAESSWRRHRYKADYEEVLYYVESICREMSDKKYLWLKSYGDIYVGMLNSDLRKELSYCDWLVNVKKRITE